MSKFLLLLGPSGVGKSAIIKELCQLDSNFTYISPFITRPLRSGENNKIFLRDEEMDEMKRKGEFLVINKLYDGIRYATPWLPIVKAIAEDRFPLLDWPIKKLKVMLEKFPGKLFLVYIAPPSIEILAKRLSKDGRDISGSRFKDAQKELKDYWAEKYVGMYDLAVVSEEGQLSDVANLIYKSYLECF